MRILLTGPFPYRSIPEKFENTYFLDSLLQGIVDAGHELIILTTAPDISSDINEKKGRVTLHVKKIGRHGNLRALFSFKPEIAKLAQIIHTCDQEKHIDVMHAHWCYEYAESCLAVDADRTVVTLHDWPDSVCPIFHNYYWKRRQTLGNRVIENARYYTVVSPVINERLHETKIDANSVVIPNSIQIEKSANAIGLNQPFTLLAVNNGFNEIKNVDTTIQAFHRIKKNYPDAKLILCGFDYEEYGAAYQYCKKNGLLNKDIEFKGRLKPDELERLYRTSTMLVHTSREESFGLILIEAMKNGCPIVAGKKSGAVPWVLENGKSGLLVDVESVEDVATGIEKMMDKSLREQYIESGYRRVRDFDEQKVLPMYMQLYESMCQKAK